MSVLVTGATGFVGCALVERLQHDARSPVRALVRSDVSLLPDGAEAVIVGDLGTCPDLSVAMKGVTHVVHLAARAHVMHESAADPLAAYRQTNVVATMHLARAAQAAGVRRFVFLSSIKAQGESGVFREDDDAEPSDPYGVSKLEAEQGLRVLGANVTPPAMDIVIVRSPLVYGPGVRANFAALLSAVSRGVPLPFSMVRNLRSLVARANLVDLLATVLEHPAAGNETFGVSDGCDLSTPALIRAMARAVGRPPRLFPVPVTFLMAAATLAGKRDVARRLLGSLQVDITKARSVLHWQPPVTVDAALEEMALAWRTRMPS